MRYPDFLKPAGRVGFIAPSFGCASLEPYHSRFNSALEFFKSKGYSPVVGENVFCDCGIGKSNTPEKCGQEINTFFMEDKSDIIISAGGGETMCEDLDHVDFKGISTSLPKWFLGYSDNTNLTFTLPTLCDTAAVYGPCASSFGMLPPHPYLYDALNFLCGDKTAFINYSLWECDSLASEENPLATLNATEPFELSVFYEGTLLKGGRQNEKLLNIPSFSGRMLGGCLDILTIICGTKYDKVDEFIDRYNNDGIIWFLESCDLNSLSTLRSLWQLSAAGWFKNARGFLIGRPMHYNENIMGMDCREATINILKKYNVPIVLDIDLGHLPPQMPFVSGALGEATVTGNSLKINYSLK